MRSRPGALVYSASPLTTCPLVRRSQPSRSVRDQYRLSGAWFHCQARSRSEPLYDTSSSVGVSTAGARPTTDTSSSRYSTLDDGGCGLPHGVSTASLKVRTSASCGTV
ncbi:Uncharacterised protein [Mycobacteroides abscessus]|nr:Uncharacterised protein [Mycobacteroides abscessus]